MRDDEQGETFGPVTVETLRAWAQDGRLAPTSMVSENAADWSPVAHFPGLGMDWVVETSPGAFYGPIHLQALEGLLKDGTIAASAILFARRDSMTDAPPQQGGAVARAEAAEQALAECVKQAEQAQRLLTAQVTQLTAQLSECEMRLQRADQKTAEANALPLFAQQITSAQEMVAQQILDAVADVQTAVAEQAEQAAALRQALSPLPVRDAVARLQAAVQDVPGEVARALAPERQEMLAAIANVQPQTVQAVERSVRDAVAAVSQQVRQLSEGLREMERALAASPKAAAPEPTAGRVYVEAEAVEVIPPAAHGQSHGRRAHAKAATHETPPEVQTAHHDTRRHSGEGLSMAELEQQAQRELERLGAQGVNLFKRKK